jgi:signal transduction histidine kinase
MLPRVTGDRVQLQQVLLNLIMNAVEAMSAVYNRPRELAIASRLDDAGAVLVEVRDSGSGLDAQASEQVFEAFYTTKPEGIGIGLSISRSIIEAHGGRLWASPNAPHGAVFQFSLPIVEEAAS